MHFQWLSRSWLHSQNLTQSPEDSMQSSFRKHMQKDKRQPNLDKGNKIHKKPNRMQKLYRSVSVHGYYIYFLNSTCCKIGGDVFFNCFCFIRFHMFLQCVQATTHFSQTLFLCSPHTDTEVQTL